MADIAAGEVFTSVAPGKSVTPGRLNNHVNGATILPAFVFAKAAQASPALGDFLLICDAAGTVLKKVTLTNLFAAQTADAAAGVASLRTLGNTGNKAAPGATTPQLAATNVFTGLTNKFVHIRGTVGATATAGAGLDSGTAVIGSNSSDIAGGVILTPAGTPAAGVQATITFDQSYSTTPQVYLIPFSDTAWAAQITPNKALRVGTVNLGSFTIVNTSTPLTAGTAYTYAYLVIGIGP